MKKVLFSLFCLCFLLTPLAASAQTAYSMQPVGKMVGLSDSDANTVFTNVARWALGIISLAAVVMVIVGGIMWMSSAGNEEKIDKAKKILTASVIGLIIVLLSWAIVYYITGSFFSIAIG